MTTSRFGPAEHDAALLCHDCWDGGPPRPGLIVALKALPEKPETVAHRIADMDAEVVRTACNIAAQSASPYILWFA